MLNDVSRPSHPPPFPDTFRVETQTLSTPPPSRTHSSNLRHFHTRPPRFGYSGKTKKSPIPNSHIIKCNIQITITFLQLVTDWSCRYLKP